MSNSKSSSGFFSFLLKDRIVASKNFNRWRIPPASIAIHLCIGSVYAWSIFNPALIKELGVASSSADDWSLGAVVWIFCVAIVSLRISNAMSHIICVVGSINMPTETSYSIPSRELLQEQQFYTFLYFVC